MKLVWCPETASKAYIDGVKTLAEREGADTDTDTDTDVAELVSAMAGGWNAQLIVEAPAPHGDVVAATTVALSAAARHTGARYVCVYSDDNSAAEHPAAAAEVVVGEAAEAMGQLQGVDMVVVDARRRDAAAVVAAARPGTRGMVVVRHHAGRRRGCGGDAAVLAGKRVVRAAYLPIGKGVEVLHVGVGKGPSLSSGGSGGRPSRWIRHVDRDTGEEHVFRR